MLTLDWLNRTDAFTLANEVPYRLVEQVSTHGAPSSAQANNLLFQSDKPPAVPAAGRHHEATVT